SSPENMKKPWSPDLPADNHSYHSDFTSIPDRESKKDLAHGGTEEKKEREKKQTNFTLCNVCNIQLNSAAQAQVHYNGKSHQKRLKQLSNGNLKSDN
ncbi:Z385B protein, partial [Chauna torquata]|nr:Z385B protein [Chauna torquata]